MTEPRYASPEAVLRDESNPLRQTLDMHQRYIEEAYSLPEQRSRVLAFAQFGVTGEMIANVLDITERTVRQHWSDLHTGAVNPQHYFDIFGDQTPPFRDIGTSSNGIWPWPWTHAITLKYTDPDLNQDVRKSVYQDTIFGGAGGSPDYLVVTEKTWRRDGYDEMERERSVYPTGDSFARHLSTTSETPWEYEANAHVIELTKGDANGEVPPDEVLGMSYDDLPTLDGTVYGTHGDAVELFSDTNVTARRDPIDWEYIREDSPGYTSGQFDVYRTDDGLELR